jgi:methanogenic corrinoid protein MtbC1
MGAGAAEQSKGARLSIGALARSTGIPVETLRTWESRYGFPLPERKPSGHRVYPVSSVARLRRIAAALGRGHRAGEVVGASEDDLTALLATASAGAPLQAVASHGASDLPALMRAVEGFEAERLTRVLLGEWARMGPIEFLKSRIAPLVHEVGEAWAKGRIEIRHEHFVSERVGDLLRSLRLPFEERARGGLVVLASLPGESHALGLQMAALVLSWAGCRVLFLGTEVPPAEIASLARDMNARAVALSFSEATRGRAAAGVRSLRTRLPRRMTLLVGGDGAPAPRRGIEVMRDLEQLEAWARAS